MANVVLLPRYVQDPDRAPTHQPVELRRIPNIDPAQAQIAAKNERHALARRRAK